MLKNRLIPVVLMRQGVCVQSKRFRRYQRLGDPTTIVERLSDWASDELIYLDISRQDTYDLGRDDLQSANHGDILSILEEISQRCFMPLTFGGGIRTLDHIDQRVRRGADKVVINTAALADPGLIDAAAKSHGSQCVIVGVDARRDGDRDWEVMTAGGRQATQRTPADWVREAADRGAGEILIQSIDEDGRGRGYDTDLIHSVASSVDVPVIALGGVGEWDHFSAALSAGADAVAAANIFNYTENSVYQAKRHLFEQGLNVREPCLGVGIHQDAA
ncbi:MAG: imidazole glycerol phosphate synthase cyclase subunit [Pirellulaceae bacterium]|jgi:cyclase|nr:imidazole glycerol phosphate synthase cyclase subunit [Pirellulaceae bacterium]MDP7019169.1 imidazole glycerol phosphate synthase cyclase subunit [Pirellulaceae bacterium]